MNHPLRSCREKWPYCDLAALGNRMDKMQEGLNLYHQNGGPSISLITWLLVSMGVTGDIFSVLIIMF